MIGIGPLDGGMSVLQGVHGGSGGQQFTVTAKEIEKPDFSIYT